MALKRKIPEMHGDLCYHFSLSYLPYPVKSKAQKKISITIPCNRFGEPKTDRRNLYTGLSG
jgi:hypothetical protein